MDDSTGPIVPNRSQQDDQISNFGLDDMQMDRFRGVLQSMNLEALPTYASRVRQFGHCLTNMSSSKTFRDSSSATCKIIELPLCGSYHIVFTIEFDDGVKWMLKVSANGHRFDSVASAALVSEARTMQLIKAETTIPVPAVYAFESTSHNDLNVPFILMERLDGQPLYQRWFDDEIPKASLEHFRVKALQSLAEAMAQLNKFTLNGGGALEFDDSGRPIGLRGAKIVDAVAIWNQGAVSEDQSGANPDNIIEHKPTDEPKERPDNDEIMGIDKEESIEGEPKKSRKSKQDENHEEMDDGEIICEKGPFDCPKSAFLFSSDRPNAYAKSDVYVKGCYKALRMFIDLAFAHSDARGRRFVLTHPDFDIQNVLVAEDGTLSGLIDWDGVASVPREIGCAQYPLWLMRDWVPFYYEYDIQERRPEENSGYEESSPAELASYRALYAHFMEKEIERQTGGPDRATAFGTLPKEEAQLTRRSLVMRDLDLAASTPFLLTNILSHVLYEIESVTDTEWQYLESDVDTCSDTSSTSEKTVDSGRGTNKGAKTCCKETLEPDSTKIIDPLSNGTAVATPVQQDNEEAAITEPLLPLVTTKVTDDSSRTQKLDHGIRPSLGELRMEAQATEVVPSSDTEFKTECSSKPVHLGWGWKLLWFGCNAAEKSLRRIAKIGHLLGNTADRMVEVLAEAETQISDVVKFPYEGDTDTSHQRPTRQAAGRLETERPEDIALTQGVREPEQSSSLSSMHAAKGLREGAPIRDTTGAHQADEPVSSPYSLKLQDIQARKVELLEAEKARKKAEYRADKAAIKEQLEVWTDVALLVKNRGVSLDQIRVNKLKIAHRVVESVQMEEEHYNDLVTAGSDSPQVVLEREEPAVQLEDEAKKIQTKEVHKIAEPSTVVQPTEHKATTTGSMVPKRPTLKSCNGSSGRLPVTDASVLVSMVNEENDEHESSIVDSSFAQNLCSRKRKSVRKAKKKPVAGSPNKASSRLGNDHPSSNISIHTSLLNTNVSVKHQEMRSKEDVSVGESVHPGGIIKLDNEATGAAAEKDATLKDTDGFSAFCSFETLCLGNISPYSSRHDHNKGKVSSNSVENGCGDTDGERSDTVKSCKSSATSLNSNEEDAGEIAATKKDGSDLVGTPVTPAGEVVHNKPSDEGVSGKLETVKEMEKMSSHKHSEPASNLAEKNESKKSRLRRRIPVEASNTNKKAISSAKTELNDGNNEVDTGLAADRKQNLDVTNDKNADLSSEDEPQSKASIDEDDSDDDDAPSFKDDGEFRSQNVFRLLGMDRLDELRLLRMQEGFLKLLEQY